MNVLPYHFFHTEIEKSWKKPFQHLSYSNVEGLGKHGYVKMPHVEEPLVGYLSQVEVSSLKAPALPS